MKPHLFNSLLANISAAFFKIILEDSLGFKLSLNKNLHDLHMDMLEKEYTMSLKEISLKTEIEMAMRMKQLTLEETRVEVFTNLCEMEVGCRERGDHHNEYLHQRKEINRKEMARQEAKQKDREASVTNEPKEWKIQEEQLMERCQWEKVMMVKEEPIRRLTANGPRKQQQQRGREEVCRSRSEEEVSFKCLNCEQGRGKSVLCNNWVGEDESDSKPVKEHSNLPSAKRTTLKSGRMYCTSFVSTLLLLNTVHSYKQSLFIFVLKKQPH